MFSNSSYQATYTRANFIRESTRDVYVLERERLASTGLGEIVSFSQWTAAVLCVRQRVAMQSFGRHQAISANVFQHDQRNHRSTIGPAGATRPGETRRYNSVEKSRLVWSPRLRQEQSVPLLLPPTGRNENRNPRFPKVRPLDRPC